MFLDDFILRLREYGVPVSLTDGIDFYKGLERGLAPDLDSLFLFARLAFVRRVEHVDAYERAFAFHFYGIDLPRVAEGDPELLNWLGALKHSRVTPDRLNVPFVGTLLKRTEDILSYRSGGKRTRVN